MYNVIRQRFGRVYVFSRPAGPPPPRCNDSNEITVPTHTNGFHDSNEITVPTHTNGFHDLHEIAPGAFRGNRCTP